MRMMKSLIMLLSLAAASASQRRVDIIDTTIKIPDVAQVAYCTAIMGYYDKCTRVPNDAPNTATMCDGATYTALDKPLFIDLVTCYANPNFEDGNSITFFGETPDKSKVIEFHIILHDGASDSLKPINCDPITGACDCSPDLLALKKQFLAQKGCQNTDQYSCLSEDWWGDSEKCFTPATDITVGGQFRCAMTAVVQQFGPCNTVLNVPDTAFDTYCTAVTGWYNECKLPDDGVSDLCAGSFYPLDTPLFVDIDSCFSNPHVLKKNAVSFYGTVANGDMKEFHMIFLSDASAATYMPTNCEPTGICQCPQALKDLKQKFLSDNDCSSNTDYFCMSEGFFGVTEHCFVPATAFLSNGNLGCSMTARIEAVEPCNKKFRDEDDTATPLPVQLPAPMPLSAPTPVPVPPPTPPPVPPPIPITQPTPLPVEPQNPDPVPVDAAPSPVDHLMERPIPSDDGTVVIPPLGHAAYCTAIMGWYDGCILQSESDDPDATMCSQARYYPLAQPEFIDLAKCYQNPRMIEHSISFFGETPDRKKVMEFHLVFKKQMQSPYAPQLCNTMGVCDCPPAIVALKKKFLAAGKCVDTDVYTCIGEDFWGVTEECFVPASDVGASDGIACSMVAKLQQFGPCDVVLDIPPAAYDAYCTAITGWYSECDDTQDPNESMCPPESFNALPAPLFIDLNTCYKNPTMPARSVSFFGKGSNGVVTEFHMIFRSGKGEHLIPTNCNLAGACQCPKALADLKASLMASGGCNDTPEYVCKSEPFFGDTDRYVASCSNGCCRTNLTISLKF